jgi:hypothetical protein
VISYKSYLLEAKNPSTPRNAYKLAVGIGKRIPSIEHIILKDPYYSFLYARNVIHGRWLEAEDIIKERPESTFEYATDIIKDRWPEAEDTIKLQSYYWREYVYFLIKKGKKALRRWLENDLNENLVKIINDMGFDNKNIQEYICIHRPDLIDKIWNLDKGLRKKYKFELNTTGIEL